MRRVVIPELLDSGAGSPEQLAVALRDLDHINRWFGGTTATTSLLRRVAERSGQRALSVLDVGAGPAETILGARQALAAEGTDLRVSLLDRAASHMPRNGVPRIVGDALALPFAAESFDVVSSSLFLHHLEPDEIVTHVNDALRVCRVAVVINDLERSAIHAALVYAGLPLFRSAFTWHDAPASVRRAYTTDELRAMMHKTYAAGTDVTRHFLFRIGVIAWKSRHV
jgi:ubiquinone/menaquinone biosynthesis C-methylase UbiE